MSSKMMTISLPKVVVDALMDITPAAYMQAQKRESNEPMYAEDVEDFKQFSKFIHAFAVEVAECNPEIMEQQKKLSIERLVDVGKSLDLGTATHDMLEQITIGHDCDTCKQAGNCEIEGLMRKAVSALKLYDTETEGEG